MTLPFEVPRAGRSTTAVRPFAIGVLAVQPDESSPDESWEVRRTEERLQVALTAHALGYFLLDVFEIWPGDAAGYERVEELAIRTDADAFVVRGVVDEEVLKPMADRIRMRIRYSGP
ncbi:MAG: hypothetical protein QG622_2942 [Actinomycetota bacterium]|nr:hypothetical protein [Actinomycetota bacterium]